MTTHETNQTRKLKWELLIAVTVLNIFALSFNILLTTASLKKQYVNSLVTTYEVIGYDLKQNIERAMRFGKSIEKFVGLPTLLNKTLNSINQYEQSLTSGQESKIPATPPNRQLAVALPDNTILYSSAKNLVGTKLPEKVHPSFKDLATEETVDKAFVKQLDDTFFISLPLRDRKGALTASAVLTFSNNKVQTLTRQVLKKNICFGIGTLITAMLLLHVFLKFLSPQKHSRLFAWIAYKAHRKGNQPPPALTKTTLSILLLSTIILCQISFSLFSMVSFQESFLKITREKTVILSTLLQEDIEFFLKKGLQLNKLYKAETILGDAMDSLPEGESITVLDADNRPLYSANQSGTTDFVASVDDSPVAAGTLPDKGEYNVSLEIRKAGEVKGYIFTVISKSRLFAKLKNIILDTLTILITSILFSFELVIILFHFLHQKEKQQEGKQHTSYGVIRPVAFVFLFAVTLSVSFVPLHMAHLYKPISGLSKDMVLGLPISIEFLTTLLIIFPCATWMDRRGWHIPFLYGAAITATGMLLSGMAEGPVEFIIYRGILGIGYGLSWMSFQGFVITYTNEKRRAKGLSNLVAGIFAGSICGGAIGAMLAEEFGFRPVFFIQAGILLTIMLVICLTMKPLFSTPVPVTKNTQTSNTKNNYLGFIIDRNIFSAFFFSIIPTSFCVVGILYFITPLYLNQIGISQSNIGRAFMVYGLCMIYIAPFISKWIDRSSNKKFFIMVGGLFSGFGLLIFTLFKGFPATITMIFMLGIASCFVSSSQVIFVLSSKATQKIGLSKAISFQRAADKLGQMLGPVLFGAIIGAVGIENGITWVGVIFLLLTLLFIIFTKEETKAEIPERANLQPYRNQRKEI